MLKYGKDIIFNPDTLHPQNIDRQSISLIPDYSEVLEIGCATGFMGEYLIKNKNCTVTGVEFRKEEAAVAKKKLNDVIVGDIEDPKVLKKLKKYDIVFASAIIEHLKNPWKAILSWRKLLKKDGSLIITTSNVVHWSIRFKMIFGRFDYTEYGILDNTHLHFFTPESFRKLITDCGFVIKYYSIDSVGGGFPKVSYVLSHFFPSLFAYQMLIEAKIK